MAVAAPSSRRIRHGAPEPRVRRLVLSDADYTLFEAIDRHGPLPSNYLYEFTKHLRKDRTHLQNRLTEFFHGDSGGSYLARPPQQFAAFEARYQHVVYDLAPRARLLLAERGALSSGIRADPFVHRLMCACVSASFELVAPSHGLRYIAARDILARPGATPARESTNALALPVPKASPVIPDFLFGLEYPGTGFRFIAVECDRNTESIERRNLRQTAFAKKLLGYAGALQSQTYRSWWGLPNLHVLTVTTSALHAQNILRFVRTHLDTSMHSAFGFATSVTFGANWRVPPSPLFSLLSAEWCTAAGTKVLSRI